MQNYYNLMYREDEREMLGLCLSEGIAVTPWSPLARGKLARPWAEEPPTERAKTDQFARVVFSKTTATMDKAVVDRTHDVARDLGLPAAQVAMAWLLSKPMVTSPIVGATKPHHLDDAVAATSVKLSDHDIARLEEVYEPRPATSAYS
jgi:aryl-alcohol dehydrogenase-like predicted oxidoreductase